MSPVFACAAPPGYVADSGDCNDFNASIHPFAAETCNDLDDDCNGSPHRRQVSRRRPSTRTTTVTASAAVNAAVQQGCDVPVGWALAHDGDGDGTDDWDCNDSDVTVFPGAPTLCDGKDNNCDGGGGQASCFSTCPGSWGVTPPQPDVTGGRASCTRAWWTSMATESRKILFQSDSAFAVIDYTGAILYQEGTGRAASPSPGAAARRWWPTSTRTTSTVSPRRVADARRSSTATTPQQAHLLQARQRRGHHDPE